MTPLPRPPAPGPDWMRHLTYRTEVVRTTWKLRGGLLVALLLVGWSSRGFWASLLAHSLVHPAAAAPSDVILVENFEVNYLLFERARELRRAGMGSRIVVTVMQQVPDEPHPLSAEISRLICRVARIPDAEFLPVVQVEPITLHVARTVRDYMRQQRFGSVLIVTGGFRSRRSALIYGPVLEAAGIRVGYVPVFGTKTPDNWTRTWHGIQEVAEQFVKLQFYRFYVLRRFG